MYAKIENYFDCCYECVDVVPMWAFKIDGMRMTKIVVVKTNYNNKRYNDVRSATSCFL